MGIGKLQGKLDEMVQWGGGRGEGEAEAGLQTLIFFSQRMDWNISPPPTTTTTTTDVQYTVRIDTCIHGLYCNLQTKRKRKMRFHNLQYRPRDKVNKIFIISLCSNRGEDFNFKQTFEFSRLYSER